MHFMSLNHFNQVEEEKLVMDLFRQEYDSFPKGRLIKTESPDFTLHNTAKISTGIELTKLHGPDYEKPDFHSFKGDSVYLHPEISYENIAFTIHAKEEKLPLYRKKRLTLIWLIITADMTDSPVSYNFSNKLDNWHFESEFHRVFLFELAKRKVFELV